VWGMSDDMRGGVVHGRPCDLMSPRPWDGRPTLAPASTWNAMGTTLGVGSVMTAAGWIGETRGLLRSRPMSPI